MICVQERPACRSREALVHRARPSEPSSKSTAERNQPILSCSLATSRAFRPGEFGMTIRLHRGDLPDLARYKDAVAIDTETMGLDPHRDRLCVVQLSPGDGTADVVQIPASGIEAPNLKRLLGDPRVLKIFHFARFDVAILFKTLGVMPVPIYCTKIASRLTRTYTDKHGLKDLV